jgi:SAM-dependent methyltransferase
VSNFKDYYSKQAAEYSKYRPDYPRELFQYLNSITLNHELALDGATGNGQAAKGLAEFFDKVIAIDGSKAQIEYAFQHPKIEYRVGKAEVTKLEPKSADLITVATALHWINLDLFYDECRRILKDDGVVAVWTYSTVSEIDSPVDRAINSFSKNVLNSHWDKDIKQVWDFEQINFPFKNIPAPKFELIKEWYREDYLNYMFTWSAVQKYIEINTSNPLDLLNEELKNVWAAHEKRLIRWEIKMKVGKLF